LRLPIPPLGLVSRTEVSRPADVSSTGNLSIRSRFARQTGQVRRIPIGKKFWSAHGGLDQAIGGRAEGPVFLGPSGKGWRVENLSRTYSRLRDLAGLPKDLVLYLARHECGTKVCRQKGIEYARRLLGHTNISTTQRYMHLDEHELADAQDLVE
jgi:site-specific recombinase XerC